MTTSSDSANTPPEKTTHRLILMPSGRQGDVPHGVTVKDAAHKLGVEIESICGGRQTCAKCLVAPEWGSFPKHGITSAPEHLSPPSEDEQALFAKLGLNLKTHRLSCAARILGDVLITVPPSSQARKQVVRKAAGQIAVTVAPAVRQYYVEVPPPSMGSAADFSRLRAALADQWDVHDVRIDLAVLRDLQAALREGDWAVTVTLWQGTGGEGAEIVRAAPGYAEGLYGLAVDIGSTTVAGYLCDLRTGDVLATASMMNPQVRYGEDLISRITYAMAEKQGKARMHRAILRALNELATDAASQAGIDAAAITDVVLVGNSVMHHLLLDIDPSPLGSVPFPLAAQDPLDLPARELGMKTVAPAAKAHILPCIAGYVGADNAAVLLAALPHLDDKVSLIVDVGTNAEILLAQGDRILSASSPTGPAFEGAQITHGQRAAPGAIERVRIDPGSGGVRYKVIGDDRWSDELDPGESLQPTGICGSGILEVVAELYTAGLILNSGRFAPDAVRRCPRVRTETDSPGTLVLARAEETATGEEIVITQKDIRSVQLAKGALYAGARLLMDRLGVKHVDRIKLAGAFGSYIDPRRAMQLGLIPDCDLAQVMAVGNAAGDGARIALLNAEQRQVAAAAARRVEYVETADEMAFQEYFVAAMTIPHAVDVFPHLEAVEEESRGESLEARVSGEHS